MSKKIYLFIVAFCLLNSSIARQAKSDKITSERIAAEKLVSTVNPSDTLLEILTRRIRNFTFLQQTMNYAPLSYASPPFCELGSPKDGYILSADIQPNFVIGGKRWSVPVHLTARYKVRIFRDDEQAGDRSLPVRTPSFMPGFTAFYPLQRYLQYLLSAKLQLCKDRCCAGIFCRTRHDR
ncbi:hypothetical protein [Pedobacter sp. JY14-1]|uniref:hypothetical protein n=1 Tax=Pedobacter sp. JY14-1 TaxID=3034151 RepID=UPI0023E1F156|nr:hypothetical protein [Pedobacter sp. JY14-1]